LYCYIIAIIVIILAVKRHFSVLFCNTQLKWLFQMSYSLQKYHRWCICLCYLPPCTRKPRRWRITLNSRQRNLLTNGRLWLSHGIWMILPWWSAEFPKPSCGIWQNFPRKTVGPTN